MVDTYKQIIEGKAKLLVPVEQKISADLSVFYNPIMEQNRNISIEFLRTWNKNNFEKKMQACDLLAGTGARAVRFLLELPKGMFKQLTINDSDSEAVRIIEKNLELNGLMNTEDVEFVEVKNLEASKLLLESSGYDYIDIDPFGTPNPFLDAACKRISRDGILAVTATDTSALAGTFPKVCMRKYWAKPRRDHMMHETGLRILIRKCQLVAGQYEKALIPVLSYSVDHYMRIFFVCRKGKARVDAVLKEHGEFNECGPMWLGGLLDEKILENMERDEFLDLLYQESQISEIGFFDLHVLCKRLSCEVPKFSKIEEELKKKGYKTCRTHFSKYGLRTDANEEDILESIKNSK